MHKWDIKDHVETSSDRVSNNKGLGLKHLEVGLD